MREILQGLDDLIDIVLIHGGGILIEEGESVVLTR